MKLKKKLKIGGKISVVSWRIESIDPYIPYPYLSLHYNPTKSYCYPNPTTKKIKHRK